MLNTAVEFTWVHVGACDWINRQFFITFIVNKMKKMCTEKLRKVRFGLIKVLFLCLFNNSPEEQNTGNSNIILDQKLLQTILARLQKML